MNWGELFERASGRSVTEADVRESLSTRRAATSETSATAGTECEELDAPREPAPTRVVADADVLAADLVLGGASRNALDTLRGHSWTTLVASDPLLDDAEAVIAEVADAALATAWRRRIERLRDPVVHPKDDHPALGSAYRGGAMQILSLDERLTSAAAGTALQGRVSVSVRTPRAFATVFDPARLYPEVGAGKYPGPDRDPRA